MGLDSASTSAYSELHVLDKHGTWLGIGSVTHFFVAVELQSGAVKHLTVLDHGQIERYYTVSAFAEANGLDEWEVNYFISRFFEWERIK